MKTVEAAHENIQSRVCLCAQFQHLVTEFVHLRKPIGDGAHGDRALVCRNFRELVGFPIWGCGDPGIDFRSSSHDCAARLGGEAAYGKPILELVTLHGPNSPAHVAGDFLPGVQKFVFRPLGSLLACQGPPPEKRLLIRAAGQLANLSTDSVLLEYKWLPTVDYDPRYVFG